MNIPALHCSTVRVACPVFTVGWFEYQLCCQHHVDYDLFTQLVGAVVNISSVWQCRLEHVCSHGGLDCL
jgi:hypothetical protein